MKWLQERINQIVSASNPITDVDDSTRVRLLNIFITTSLVASTIIFLLAIITKDLPETMRLTSPLLFGVLVDFALYQPSWSGAVRQYCFGCE
jgi:hypothetical protein